MVDRRALKQRLRAASDFELRALVEAHERKIEALLNAPSRRFGAWLRHILEPLSVGRLRRLQTFQDYIERVDRAVLKRGAPAAPYRPGGSVVLPPDIPAFWRQASLGEAIDLTDRLLAAHDHRGLFLLIDSVADAAPLEREIARSYALTLLFDQQRIFTEAASSAAHLLARPDLRAALGRKAALAIVAAEAHALARLGRVDNALRALDAALTRFSDEPDLRRLRAEIVWPRDRETAIADLEAAIAAGHAVAELRVLRQHLLMARGGFDRQAARTEEEEHFWHSGKELPRDFQLLFANAAGAAGNLSGQRELFDRFFALQGLHPCIDEAWKAVEFRNLGNPRLPRASTGPLVSVVMTAFNAESTIAHSVRSVLDQTHENFELLVVDDASEDDTAAIAAALAERDGRISLLRNARNSGTYVARNRALDQARGAYFTFQDADDWCHPERLARHVELMEANSGLAASRSLLIRMNDAGSISLKRWGGRFAHLNPASAFCKMTVRDEIGFFDSVRVGADSEHWFRIRNRLGPDAVAVIPLALTIALHHERSLTRFGAGALDEAGHSPVREQYQKQWLAWHRAQAQSRDLYLPARQPERRFPAPPEIAVLHAPDDLPDYPAAAREPAAGLASAHSGTREIVFGISLAARRTVADWDRAVLLLRATLRSVLAQTDPRFRVLVCGHDRPPLSELGDPRVEFLVSLQPAPAEPKGFRRDKMHKRRLIASRLRQLGGGYFFPLDADDLVSNRLVAEIRSDDNRRGYSLTEGYVLDWNNRRLAPVPGAWDATFDRVCGSSAALFFEADELPDSAEAESGSYFELFGEHAYWPVVAEEYGRKLQKLRFPAGIYVVNHDQNLSYRLQRNARRQQNIMAAIAAHRIPITPKLAAEFSLPEEFVERSGDT